MGPLRDVSTRDAGRFVEWATATRRLPGESAIGDRAVVCEFQGGVILAAVDGIGHGTPAAAPAGIAIDLLRKHSEAPVEMLIQLCHEALRGTRGAAVSIGSVDARTDTLTWIAVGNVEAVTIPFARDAPQHHVISGAGIVGYRLPALVRSSIALHPGDLIVFATDGVSPQFADSLRPVGSARRIAERILESYGKSTDDALVLVARYLGGSA